MPNVFTLQGPYLGLILAQRHQNLWRGGWGGGGRAGTLLLLLDLLSSRGNHEGRCDVMQPQVSQICDLAEETSHSFLTALSIQPADQAALRAGLNQKAN